MAKLMNCCVLVCADTKVVKLIKEEFTMNFYVVRNDITNMKTDAIVLPANTLLKEGSGTSKAIFEKAGRAQLEKACTDFLKKYHHVHVVLSQ